MAETQEHLARFYRDLQDWIDGGCGPHGIFDPTDSICLLAIEWTHAYRIDRDQFAIGIGDSFEAAGLSRDYPFNGNFLNWWREDEPYLNPARLAWIAARAEGVPVLAAMATPDGAERVHEQVVPQPWDEPKSAFPNTPYVGGGD